MASDNDDDVKRRIEAALAKQPYRIPLDRIKPPSSPPAATPHTPMVNGEILALTHRQTRALESIAASLEKLANPPVTVIMTKPTLVPDDE